MQWMVVSEFLLERPRLQPSHSGAVVPIILAGSLVVGSAEPAVS